MTPERALDRLRNLVALAAPTSGASEEERRSAAVQVVRMMLEHGLVPAVPTASAIDMDQVSELALRVVKLEQLLSERQRAHAAEVRDRDQQWRQIVEKLRKEGRVAVRRAAKSAATKAAIREREAQSRAGGRGRAEKLDPERRREIGRAAVAARWQKWRERHGGQHE
jgi:hypothetical protein